MRIISVVQFRPRLASCVADVSDNLRKVDRLIHDAWAVGSQLVVFPELFLTGYSFMSGEEAAKVAEPWDGRTFKSMRDIAVQLKSYVAWGYPEVDGKNLYNSATVVGPDGSVACKYRKINLWGNDFLWATPGLDPALIVPTEIGMLSVVVCRDLRDEIPKNIPRTASENATMFPMGKPDVVAACVNWGRGGFPPVSWMDFVGDNKCVLAVANRWGKEEASLGFSQDFGHGGSAIVEPNWKVHTSGLKFGEDCIVSAALEDLTTRRNS